MYKVVLIFATILFVLNNSCQQPTQADKNSITIEVQPFSDISTEETNYVVAEIKKVYPNIILNKSISLPASAFYVARNRYRADSLINFLNRRTADNHVTIGLTGKDISATKDSIVDWGVTGLGFCPGKACIASTFRLPKSEQLIQLFKVAIHELGHTQGLPHCAVKSCFMRDAEGGNPTTEEKDFCAECKSYLVKKGWVFK